MDTNPDGTSKHFHDGLSAPIEEGNLAFMGFPVLHGSYETVAELIATLERDTGIGGLLLTFIDFVPDIRRFGEKVLPLVRERRGEHQGRVTALEPRWGPSGRGLLRRSPFSVRPSHSRREAGSHPLPIAAPRWLAFCTALDGSFEEGTKGTGDAAIIGSSEAVMTRFSVAPIPARRSSSASLVELCFRNILPHERVLFDVPEKFYGTIDNWELGQISSLSRSLISAPVRYDRAKQHLRGRSENDLVDNLFATKSSARSIQGHNVLHCKKDGFFIQRAVDLPYQFSHAENNELWVLEVAGADAEEPDQGFRSLPQLCL